MTERCSRHTRHIYGAANRSYDVAVVHEIFSCTCPAYAISKRKALATDAGWCAHLHALSTTLCQWEGDPVIPGVCPLCQSPTKEVMNNGQE